MVVERQTISGISLHALVFYKVAQSVKVAAQERTEKEEWRGWRT